MAGLEESIESIIGRRPERVDSLAGGCVGEVYRVCFDDGDDLVAKVGKPGDPLDLEGWMLNYLASNSTLPVPDVVHAEDRLLLMTYLESGDPIDPDVEVHAGELLADLHDISAARYGLERDTLIGPLAQPNSETDDWLDFFRDHRLVHMAREAHQAGKLTDEMRGRVEGFAERISEFVDPPEAPSLVHGDMWTGNVLAYRGRIAGFIDPAIYYGDAEMDLAMSTLFSTFGQAFFQAYGERRPIRPGFFDSRRDIYNLYPLLVHVRLFGGGYAGAVERIIARFGF